MIAHDIEATQFRAIARLREATNLVQAAIHDARQARVAAAQLADCTRALLQAIKGSDAPEAVKAAGGNALLAIATYDEACGAAPLPEDPIELLDLVRQCYTRDDGLPDDLLPRIDAVIDAARPHGAVMPRTSTLQPEQPK